MSHPNNIPETSAPLKRGWRLEGGILRGPAPSLSPGPALGFTTRALGDLGELDAQAALARREGARRVRMLRQVHGTRLLPPDAAEALPEGDGWVGVPAPGELLAVRTADCLPLLLWSEGDPRVAAVHAGWRGAVAGIASRAVEALGVPPRRVFALLGPAIGPCCFEVGGEVALAAARHPHTLAPRCGEKYLFDLEGFVLADLLAAGCLPERVFASGLCTRCRQDLFYSYRAGAVTGRMAAYIGRADGEAP